MKTPDNQIKNHRSNANADQDISHDANNSPVQFADNRPENAAQRSLQDLANNSDNTIQQKKTQEMVNASSMNQNAIQLQTLANSTNSSTASSSDKNSGLPAQLKSGIESLSGESMDDVNVHRNSAKPAQMQAHAFAQGNDIHLAAGQEKHLAHEAWHVVQQKQGRVKPTAQLKGQTNINDEAGLEKEADVMGQKAISTAGATPPLESNTAGDTVQLMKNNQVNGPAVIQRAIDDDAFDRLDHSLNPSQGAGARSANAIIEQGGVKFALRKTGQVYEVLDSGNVAQGWQAVTAAELRDNYSYTEEKLSYKVSGEKHTKTKGNDNVQQNGEDGDELVVKEFAGDDMAMVHHTSGTNCDPHLTVENAHFSAMVHLNDWKGLATFNKGAKLKPDHEKIMTDYDYAPVDNLNFFDDGHEKGVYDLSLQNYLDAVSHAMDKLPKIPPVYGVEIIRSANMMAQENGLDTSQLFLPKESGLERELFKAAMNMHKMQLITVPAPIAADFAGYAQAKPSLFQQSTGNTLAEGEKGFNQLQKELTDQHLPALIAYLQTL